MVRKAQEVLIPRFAEWLLTTKNQLVQSFRHLSYLILDQIESYWSSSLSKLTQIDCGRRDTQCSAPWPCAYRGSILIVQCDVGMRPGHVCIMRYDTYVLQANFLKSMLIVRMMLKMILIWSRDESRIIERFLKIYSLKFALFL